MSALEISARLRALVAFGDRADLALLGRLGCNTMLYADSRLYRARSRAVDVFWVPENEVAAARFGLDRAQAFAFVCEHLASTNAVYPLANEAASYNEAALQRVVRSSVPAHTYLLMAAIEASLPAVVDNVIAWWNSDATRAAEKRHELGRPLSETELPGIYQMPTDYEDCTVSAFLFGRTVERRQPALAMLSAPSFAHNISTYTLDQALRSMALASQSLALQIAFTPATVARSALDPTSASEEHVQIKLTERARALVETAAHRSIPRAAEWFSATSDEQATLLDILEASRGQIDLAHASRARHVEIAAPPPPIADPDADVDDKLMR